MTHQAINLSQKLELFTDHWSPKIIESEGSTDTGDEKSGAIKTKLQVKKCC